MSGPLPARLGDLPNLAHIYLQGNRFNGAIPTSIGKLSKLNWLYLTSNQLEDSEPGAFRGLYNIRGIYLGDNGLSASAVSQIINELYLDRNAHTYTGAKSLVLDGINNSQPDANALNQVTILRSTYNWTITCNGC